MFEYSGKVLRVVDGDTLIVDIDLGFSIRRTESVRVAGINAYETSLRGGTTEAEKLLGLHAKSMLVKILTNETVKLKTEKEKGKFGRYIAHVFVDISLFGEPIRGELVKVAEKVVDDGVVHLGNFLVEAGFAEFVDY